LLQLFYHLNLGCLEKAPINCYYLFGLYPDDEIRTVCLLVWPDGFSGVSFMDYIYNLVFFIVTYVIPFISMMITYTWMGVVLWRSESIGEVTERQRHSVKAKKNVVRMLVLVVIIFAACWLPYHMYFLYVYHYPNVVHQKYTQHIYLAFYWLAMSNSVYNPIIYYKMNE
ncbi:tachykinin-like peptides receptor 86C, partial [Dinothrombium tinctorium]